jgi:4a-hydroxytetrahydrobiopterin dehydratase
MELLNAQCREVSESDRIDDASTINDYLGQLHSDWIVDQNHQSLDRHFNFKDYFEVMLFANYVAALSNQEDHHPKMTLEYKTALLEYRTHSAQGLSINDFICAAKIDHYLGSLS